LKPVLLLVDLQNDFLKVAELEPHPASVIAAAARLLGACRRARIPAVHIRSAVKASGENRMPHWKRNDYWACVEGSGGHACPPSLVAREDEAVIHKVFFSAFSTGELDGILRETKAGTLIVAGVHLHGCVRATVLDAYARDYKIVVAEDATGSNDPLHGAITRRYLQDRAAQFLSSGRIARELDSGADAFASSEFGRRPEALAHRSPQAPERSWTIAADSEARIREAVARARTSFETWSRIPIQERASLLGRIARLLKKQETEFADLIVEDAGKPIRQARGEVARSLALLDAVEQSPAPDRDAAPGRAGYRREPLGVVGLISPFNNPLAIPAGKIAPALLHGNTVVWKPAIPGARVAERFSALIREAGGPEGVIACVHGGPDAARNLMSHCDAVTISGSLEAGRSAQDICASRQIPLQAELGGNNAAIVWDDADLAAAAASIAEGAFAFAGQRCTANRRVIILDSVYDRFLDHLAAACRSLVWGEPASEETQIGPLITCHAKERVEALVRRAGESGSRLIHPHEPRERAPDAAAGSAWLRPAIVCCDDREAEIVREETFGPVLVAQRAGDWEDAMALCNGVRQGLAAALFSTSQERIAAFLREAKAGVLKINQSTADAAVHLPFGGWKSSGIGPPEHGPANIEFFTRMQAIYYG
jgi:acyl-CoA reductase-like NAD-dependent aldehyde dehydrogenase/nicotinamidase-related amidase